VRRMMLSAVAAVCCLALAVPAVAAGNANRLTGTVGPGFTITMSKKTVKAGTYKIVIRDRSSIHNFHLSGPGVNKKTSVAAVRTTTWTVKLKKGTYKFVCDPHASIMRGALRVA
jgi:plastocyanin